MNIHESSVRVTRCCHSSFLLRNNATGKDRCPCGKVEPEMFTPWFDESGDIMFEVVSDVRQPA